MARSVLVDAGFLVALLNRRDAYHPWAAAQAVSFPPTWITCEAALSEAFHLLGANGMTSLSGLLRRSSVRIAFELNATMTPILNLMHKYANVPMSLADACLVRMSEVVADPLLLTTDSDFRVYRRHGRQMVPCVFPT
jgi:uncharacterized protein